MSVVNVKDLRGPFSDYAAEIVDSASRMSLAEAIRLVEIWDATGDQSQYLKDCAAVWDALESSQRLLPLGWFERTFREVDWLVTEPRALHAVADAVSVTLVRDLVTEDVVHMLLSPWRVARATETAGV